jgi:hypothetical protein
VVLDRAGEDRIEVHRELRLVDHLDQRAHVDDGATAQQRRPADQRSRVVRIGPASQALWSRAEQPRPGDRPGGSAIDRIERGDHAKLVQRQRHAGGNGAPHAAALDREGDAVRIGPVTGATPRPHALIDDPQDFMHHRNVPSA